MLAGATRVLGPSGWTTVEALVAGEGARAMWGTEYLFKPVSRSQNGTSFIVFADRPHFWPLRDGTHTYDLRIGDIVPAWRADQDYSSKGWLHGYLKRKCFTSGVYSENKNRSIWGGRLRMLALDAYPVESGMWHYTFEEYPWQTWPADLHKDYEVDSRYIGSFIQGYCDAYPSKEISTVDATAAKWLKEHAVFGGYIASGDIGQSRKQRRQKRVTEAPTHDVFTFRCIKGKEHSGFKCVRISRPSEKLTVFRRPVESLICLEGGLQTYL